MSDRVKKIESFTLTLPRETPYLGKPRPGGGAERARLSSAQGQPDRLSDIRSQRARAH